MVQFLGLFCFLVLSFLAGIHVYWALGGKWGITAVLPTDEKGTRKLNPGLIITLVVSIALAGIATLYGVKSKLFSLEFIPSLVLQYGLYISSGIFLLRAIGDFKYVGFTKKIKKTTFAKNDTKWFSPLCLFLGVTGFFIAIVA